jgi:predicted ATPase
VREEGGRPILSTLGDYLRTKKMLLVLDNCEHMIEACAKLADTLLHSCTNLRLLATSREALGIAGETTFPVPSLSLPGAAQLSPEMLPRHEAVRLFLDRALAVQPSFKLTHHNASAVAQVCKRLDGMPLAIELAAARVKGLSVEQIAQRLDDRFRLLTGGSRTALPRHQTLRALIDWSYELLSVSERMLLRRLSVFAGGWTSEAAEAVCAADSVTTGEILDLLLRLVDKSLVLAEAEGSEARYRMLETIRQYALDKLLESGEAENTRARHLKFFLGFAERVEPKLRGPEQLYWLDQIEMEHDNLRTALEWSLGGHDAEAGLRMAGALPRFWEIRGYSSEGQRWVEEALAQTPADSRTAARAKALSTIADLVGSHYDVVALQRASNEAMKLWRELGDKWWIVFTQTQVGWAALLSARDLTAARGFFEQAVGLAMEVEDKWLLADSLRGLGAAVERSDYDAARPILEKSVSIWRWVGDKVELATALNQLGTVALGQRDYEQAATLFEESLALYRDMRDRGGIISAGYNLVLALLGEGETDRAAVLGEETLALAVGMGSQVYIASTLLRLGGVAMARGKPERSVRLLIAAESLLTAIGLRIASWPFVRAEYDRYVAATRGRLDEATFEKAWAEGQAMTLEQAIELAMSDK